MLFKEGIFQKNYFLCFLTFFFTSDGVTEDEIVKKYEQIQESLDELGKRVAFIKKGIFVRDLRNSLLQKQKLNVTHKSE